MSDLFACITLVTVCTGERTRLDMPTSVTRWHARTRVRSPVRRCTARSHMPLSLRPPVCRLCLSSGLTCLCAPRQSTGREAGSDGRERLECHSLIRISLSRFRLSSPSVYVRMDIHMPLTYEKDRKQCVSNERAFILTYTVNDYTYRYHIHS